MALKKTTALASILFIFFVGLNAEYPKIKKGTVVVTNFSPRIGFIIKAGKLYVDRTSIIWSIIKTDNDEIAVYSQIGNNAKTVDSHDMGKLNNTNLMKLNINPIPYDNFTKYELQRLDAMSHIRVVKFKYMFGLLSSTKLFFDGNEICTNNANIDEIYSAFFINDGVLCSVKTKRMLSLRPLDVMYIDLHSYKAETICLSLERGPLKFNLFPLF